MITGEKKKIVKVKAIKKDNLEHKSFQIKMNERVHQLLKERAQQQQMPIGEFIQNLLATLEETLESYKAKYGFDEIKSDKLDAKLIKFLMIKDAKGFTPEEITLKLEQMKNEFESSKYKPKITLIDWDQ